MAKIVAIANQKGGVGKTTTAVNLSSCVAALGKKTLIVDLDPQGNTTTGYGIPKRSVDVGTYELLIGEAEARDAIRKTEFRTDVIGSNTRLAGAGLEMIDLPGRESRLRKALASVQKDYFASFSMTSSTRGSLASWNFFLMFSLTASGLSRTNLISSMIYSPYSISFARGAAPCRSKAEARLGSRYCWYLPSRFAKAFSCSSE